MTSLQLSRDCIAIEDGFYALGGSVPAREPSWMPPEARGHLPIQSYLLRDGQDFILVDTGVGRHRDAIRAILKNLTAGATGRLLMTRREPDAIINLPWIVSEFPVTSVAAGGELNPLDYFDSMDEASTYALMHSTVQADFSILRAGTIVTLGERKLEFLRTSLKVLATNWIYEHTSKTLFSSDSWSYTTSPFADGPFVVRPGADDPRLAAPVVEAHLARKFDWLTGIDVTPIKDDLISVFSDHEVERICPTSGGIIEGRDAIRALVSATLEALDALGRSERKSVMAGFTWHGDSS